MGRPAFQPTEDNRKKVERMASVGIPHAQIAIVFDISPKTLRKHFRSELDRGAIQANFEVLETLFKMATSGNNTAATIFWGKTRCNMHERPPEPASREVPSEIEVKLG